MFVSPLFHLIIPYLNVTANALAYILLFAAVQLSMSSENGTG